MGGKISTPIKRLGAWLVRANNTTYLAATDGFVIAFDDDTGGLSIIGYTDGSFPPITKRADLYDAGTPARDTLTMPVKKDDYWKVVGTGTITVFWIPLEP